MRFDLSALARRAKNPRRKSITLRDIAPPSMYATDLYRSSYVPVITLLNTYADRLNSEYARTLSSLQTDSADDLTSILAELSDALSRLYLNLTPSLRDFTVRYERYFRGRWRGAVLAATSVDLQTLLGPEDVQQTLEEAINWNVALVQDVGEQGRGKMASAVFAGLRARSPAADVAKQIRDATGFARDRSQRIAADQLSKLHGSLAEERQRQAGITQVEWRHSLKRHPRAWHAERNGKLFDLDTHTEVGGGETVPKGDWASEPPYCGCRTLARLSFE